jgi:histidine triad (HIT) family protein
MSFVLPLDRLYESQGWIAFRHPHPGYPFHVLLVPKQAIRSLTDLSDDDAPLLTELVEVVKIVISQYGLENEGYRLIANGGQLQDIPQLHFHLVSESPAAGRSFRKNPANEAR